MSQKEEYKIAFCRTCLQESQFMQSLYKDVVISDRTEQLAAFLTELTSLDCAQGDGLPVFICQECVLKITDAISFKTMCFKSDNILRGNEIVKIEEILLEETRVVEDFQEVVEVTPISTKWERDPSPPLLQEKNIKTEKKKNKTEKIKKIPKRREPKAKKAKEAKPKTRQNTKRKFNITLPPGPPYKCPYCDKVIAHAENCWKHIVYHLDEKPFKCDLCGQKFKFIAALEQHMAKSHLNKTKQHKCDICDKSFNVRSQLVNHTLIHSAPTFLCPTCGKTFSQKALLKTHMQCHSDERPYECQICKKTFNRRNNLNIHKAIHNTEKSFECKQCPLTFATKKGFKRHAFIHTGERPYPCKVCNKEFNRSHILKTHMYQHTGERPYNCKICQKGFIQKICYTGHMERHHPQHTFEDN